MKQKIFFSFLSVLLLFVSLPAGAVLKEKDLDNTLSILRSELTSTYQDILQQEQMMQISQEQISQNLMDIYGRAAQNSLMLYSQKSEYIFDLTYACHEATSLYRSFQQMSAPFRNYINRTQTEMERYDSLIVNLTSMPVVMMSERAQVDRKVCLTLAISIRRSLKESSTQMEDFVAMYRQTEDQLRNLNDYANQCYADIQSSIFRNSGESFIAILSSLGKHIHNALDSAEGKYRIEQNAPSSQWSARVVLMLFAIIILYGFIAFALNILVMRWLLPRRFRTKSFIARRRYVITATSVITLAVLLMMVRLILVDQNFLVMASGLLVEYMWLLAVVLVSLLLRLDDVQIKSSFRIYTPVILMGFIVITFRIVLIPNAMVNLIFPPILLICTIWQWALIRQHNDNIPRTDVLYTYITLLAFITSTACSWFGYTLLSVQILIWWLMQLSCLLTITCLSGWIEQYGRKRGYEELPVTATWFYDLCRSVLIPVLGVASFIIAIYWAADVFNMGATTGEMMNHRFIDTPNFQVSAYALVVVAMLYFLFHYLNRMVKELLAIHFERSDHSTAASRNMLARNIVQIVVWGAWVLIAMSLLHVSNTWLVVVSGGLSTGIGFASKDILENIYYGISLMAGRVKIGDLIECDGTRGTVASISYTSTMLSIADGSVIAFQNSQLFTKNYKNLTKNHGYECDKIEIGVAYGSDIDRVRQMLIENISRLEFLEEGKPVTVVLDNFSDSCLTLKVLVWVPVLSFYACDGAIRETIYKTLNANNVEIPFPQTDVHIKNC